MCFWNKTKKIPIISGAVPSPVDTRDILLSSVQTALPLRQLPKNYLVPYILRISDQGVKPHCVGYSAATLKEEKEMREQQKLSFDGDWLYNDLPDGTRIGARRVIASGNPDHVTHPSTKETVPARTAKSTR